MNKNLIIFSALALAEFLSPYGESNNFLVESHKNKVAVIHESTEYEIDIRENDPHLRALELALFFSKDEIERQAIEKDFLLFTERENYLCGLPEKTDDEEEDILDGISEQDKERFEAFRQLKS